MLVSFTSVSPSALREPLYIRWALKLPSRLYLTPVSIFGASRSRQCIDMHSEWHLGITYDLVEAAYVGFVYGDSTSGQVCTLFLENLRRLMTA